MKILTTVMLTLATAVAFAQNKPFKATPAQNAALKKQAQDCAAAMMKQNYKQMAYYTYPPIVKTMGGEDKMATKIQNAMGQMLSQGVIFKSVTIGEVKDVVKSNGDLYSTVQDILQLSVKGTIITSSSYLLAYSHNNGIRWYFVDTAPMKNQNMKQLFPTYPPGYVIPQAHSMMGNN